MSDIHYFGIRHHGPGSSQRLLAALQALQPACVLIEGPTDCSELLPLLAAKDMHPPVALLAYAAEDASCSVFYPFVEYSPEYQATLYAIRHQTQLAFIDVPVNIQLAKYLQDKQKEQQESEQNGDSPDDSEPDQAPTNISEPVSDHALLLDPIGELAHLAGYEDGEAWWNDLIEQNGDSNSEIFTVVESAMQALRDTISPAHPGLARDLVREAYMRLEIAKAKKNADGPIAVVCGAWHVPALKAKHTAKSDREQIKTLPAKLTSKNVKATWVPWTSARLASSSGYGAGVDAPMWYQHLWHQQAHPQRIAHWLTLVANELRQAGQVVSTASVIEATRLCQTLAAVRNRPSVGFEEVREAVIACLCFGEASIWQQIESQLLLGNQVGHIPADAPLIPLIEDLQGQQKKHKLKPEALPRELSLDLRSDAGLGKSILLHRLTILSIDWGTLGNSGKSRGTFRENWTLAWQPEFSVKLVENLVYGSTIEQAAANKLLEQMQQEKSLSKLASQVNLCLEAQLDQAASRGIDLLAQRAAHTSDCIDLLESIAPLIDISRYGTARAMSFEHIDALIERLTLQAAIAMPYACRNLDDDESWHYRQAIGDAHQALLLTDWACEVEQQWWQSLNLIVESNLSNRQIAGLSSRLLYQADKLSNEELDLLLSKMLSPAIAPADAARYFDGFFTNAVDRLLYDDLLLSAIEHWLISLEESSFIEFLPLFRRIFADLDSMERKRLIDRVLQGRAQGPSQWQVNPAAIASWPKQLDRISALLKRDKHWQQ